MRHLGTSILLLAALGLAAATAFAGAPLPGNYQSSDLGGVIGYGRYTEGWQSGGGALAVGTTLNAQSWNGTSLGSDWKYWCATEQAPATLMFDAVNTSGNGNRTYMKTFQGGVIWLSGTGPWANGDPEYAGVIDTYAEFETIQYSNWVPIAAVSNVQATAHFNNYPSDCLAFQISNGTRIGTTDLGGVKPADYPAFLYAGTCAEGAPYGAWWQMTSITLSISSGCATPSKPSTWGSLKALYR